MGYGNDAAGSRKSPYPSPESKLNAAIPRMDVSRPTLGRPSMHLGSIFHSQMNPPVNLFKEIMPSPTLPFSTIRTPKSPDVSNMQRVANGLQVGLAGTNLPVPKSLPPGITSNPNFQRLAANIRNTQSVFTRNAAARIIGRGQYGARRSG